MKIVLTLKEIHFFAQLTNNTYFARCDIPQTVCIKVDAKRYIAFNQDGIGVTRESGEIKDIPLWVLRVVKPGEFAIK